LDEARQERLARGVDLAGPGRGRGRVRHPAHPAENLTLHEDAGVLNRRSTVPIDEQRVLDQERAGGHGGNSRYTCKRDVSARPASAVVSASRVTSGNWFQAHPGIAFSAREAGCDLCSRGIAQELGAFRDDWLRAAPEPP